MPTGMTESLPEFPLVCPQTIRQTDKKTCLPDCWLASYGRSMFIGLVNEKGGVGKSTLAVHLAVWLSDRGAKVALVDCDKQRSSSQWMAECEPKVTISVVDTPDNLAVEGQGLRRSHDFVVGDGPAGLADMSRTLLLLADLAIFPISPSILDLRSVAQATAVLKFAHSINQGRPEGRLVLNRMRTRDNISRELRKAAPSLGLTVGNSVIRDLQIYRDAAQQGTVVTRMGSRGATASQEISQLFVELLTDKLAFINEVKTDRQDNFKEGTHHDRKKVAQ